MSKKNIEMAPQSSIQDLLQAQLSKAQLSKIGPLASAPISTYSGYSYQGSCDNEKLPSLPDGTYVYYHDNIKCCKNCSYCTHSPNNEEARILYRCRNKKFKNTKTLIDPVTGDIIYSTPDGERCKEEFPRCKNINRAGDCEEYKDNGGKRKG